jgi:hypothetical protein
MGSGHLHTKGEHIRQSHDAASPEACAQKRPAKVHHNQPSTLNARSIWAVAASTSLRYPVSAGLQEQLGCKVPMRSRLPPRPQQADKTRCVFQRRQIGTRSAIRPTGRHDHARRCRLEIRRVCHARTMGQPRRRSEAQTIISARSRGTATGPRTPDFVGSRVSRAGPFGGQAAMARKGRDAGPEIRAADGGARRPGDRGLRGRFGRSRQLADYAQPLRYLAMFGACRPIPIGLPAALRADDAAGKGRCGCPRSACPGGAFFGWDRPESAAQQGENRPYARFPRKVEQVEYLLLIVRWVLPKHAIQNIAKPARTVRANTAPNTRLKGTGSRAIGSVSRIINLRSEWRHFACILQESPSPTRLNFVFETKRSLGFLIGKTVIHSIGVRCLFLWWT